MAVVIVMLPGAPGTGAAAGPHTYKLSLTADSDTASVEVDGQPLGDTRIQRVSPQAGASVAGARDAGRARVVAGPSLSGPRVSPPRPFDVDDPRLRQMRRPPTTTMRPPTLEAPDLILNPNGAPIID